MSNNKLLINVNLDDQIFVENVCTNSGYTFDTFFSHLLNLYKRSLNEPMSVREDAELATEFNKKKKNKAKE